MNEVPTTKLLAVIAVIFVTAALISLPYQNQVANAQPTKRYQFIVTLTNVPSNAEDLIMNVTVIRMPFFVAVSDTQIKTVSSPSEDERIRFAVRVPSGSDENAFLVCGNTEDLTLSSCDLHSLPSERGGGPIRVDYSYPT